MLGVGAGEGTTDKPVVAHEATPRDYSREAGREVSNHAAAPQPFVRTPARKGGPSAPHVAALYGLHMGHKATFDHHGWNVKHFDELDGSKAATKMWDKAASDALYASPFGATVHTTAPDPSELGRMRLFLTADKTGGFALDKDRIALMFKHPGSGLEGLAHAALALAVQEGGRKLAVWDTALAPMVADSGFRAVARRPFDEKAANRWGDWPTKKLQAFNGGKPDLVYMVYDPQHPQRYTPGEGVAVRDDAGGEQEQDRALAAIDRAHEGKDKAAAPTTPAKAAKLNTQLWPQQFPHVPSRAPTVFADFRKYGIPTKPMLDEEKIKLLQHWNSKLAMSPAVFKQHMLGGMKGTMEVGYAYQEHNKEPQTDVLILNGTITDDAGKEIGRYSNEVNFLGNTALALNLELDPEHQGADIGKRLLRGQVDLYKALGMQRVTLEANIDVGGYAWARYGFVPSVWVRGGGIKEKIDDQIERDKTMPEEDRASLRKLLYSDDPKAIWAIADSKYGKQLLKGTTWDGDLNFNDPQAMNRFNAYVGSKTTPVKLAA